MVAFHWQLCQLRPYLNFFQLLFLFLVLFSTYLSIIWINGNTTGLFGNLGIFIFFLHFQKKNLSYRLSKSCLNPPGSSMNLNYRRKSAICRSMIVILMQQFIFRNFDGSMWRNDKHPDRQRCWKWIIHPSILWEQSKYHLNPDGRSINVNNRRRSERYRLIISLLM